MEISAAIGTKAIDGVVLHKGPIPVTFVGMHGLPALTGKWLHISHIASTAWGPTPLQESGLRPAASEKEVILAIRQQMHIVLGIVDRRKPLV